MMAQCFFPNDKQHLWHDAAVLAPKRSLLNFSRSLFFFCIFHHVDGSYWGFIFINVTGARLLKLLETRLGRYKLQHARGPKIFHVVWGKNKLYRTWSVSSFSKKDLNLGILEVSATRLKVMPMNNAWQRGNSCLELFVEQQSARACLTSLIWRLANGSRRKQERKKLGGRRRQQKKSQNKGSAIFGYGKRLCYWVQSRRKEFASLNLTKE